MGWGEVGPCVSIGWRSAVRYPVGLKATPHPKVEGPQLDEKVNNMMPK